MQKKKTRKKWLKPWHMGTHLSVLSESYQMNTNKTGFRLFSKIFTALCFVQGLSQQGVQVSFWHPGPRKTPILGGKDTLSLGQNFLKILILTRYFKSVILKW